MPADRHTDLIPRPVVGSGRLPTPSVISRPGASGTRDAGPQSSPWFTCSRVDPDLEPERMRRVFALRYEVYCLDRGFLAASDHPDGLERDAYDERSLHFATEDSVGLLLGYVRLVRSSCFGDLPFEQHCTPGPHPAMSARRGMVAEVSRMMLHRDYRRRTGDAVATGLGQDHRAQVPHLLLGMYRQMYRYSCDAGIRWWYAAMEPGHARALARLHIGFEQIGPEADYYGPVAPYFADLRAIEKRLANVDPALLQWMSR